MPLHYELEVLDELIGKTLHPKNQLTDNSVSDQQFEDWNNILLSQKEIIKKQIRKVTYGYEKESHRKLYIQQHQSAIARLKNQLMDFLMPMDSTVLYESEDDLRLVKLYKRSLNMLQDLTSFLRDEFKNYFDEDEKVPLSRLLMIQHDVKGRLIRIRKLLLKAGHDGVLIELIVQTIIIHCNNETCLALTYRRFGYFKFLMSSLEKMKVEEIQASYYPPLPALLFYLNFNTTAFKNYMVKLIHADINAGPSIEDKIEIISFHHKEISQLPVKAGMSLTPTLPSVQLDLVTWLFTEMTHLEKKQTLGIVAPVQFKDPQDPDAEKGIYSQLTVEELALLFKAFKETSILKNKNMKQVARRVAEDWHTKQKENISWQYLYNSMSTIEALTVNGLESKMVDVVNWLRKLRNQLK